MERNKSNRLVTFVDEIKITELDYMQAMRDRKRTNSTDSSHQIYMAIVIIVNCSSFSLLFECIAVEEKELKIEFKIEK